MAKTYGTISFPLSDVDPAGIDQGLIPNRIEEEGTKKIYLGINAIKYNLRNILLTIPNESASDASFGVGLSTYLFELETIDWSLLKGKIDEQITRYVLNEGYIKRFKTEVRTVANQNTLIVKISFVPSGADKIDSVEVTASG